MAVKMIIAVDRDNAIGNADRSLPWKSSTDLQLFKKFTTGNTVLMGRETFLSLRRPTGLPNRRNVVLSRSCHEGFDLNGIEWIRSFSWIHEHQTSCIGCPVPDLWIIGGASVYEQALDQEIVDEIYVTRVLVHSGAPVKVKYDLFNLNPVIPEKKNKHIWVSYTIATPDTPSSEPEIEVFKLEKRK